MSSAFTLQMKLRTIRMLMGWRQVELANRLGVKQGVIAKYEQGRHPKRAMLELIAEETGYPLNWLLGRGPLEGFFVCRLLKPGIKYNNTTLAKVRQSVEELLPAFLNRQFVDTKVFRFTDPSSGSLYVLVDSDKCFVLFSAPSFGTLISGILENFCSDKHDCPVFFLIRTLTFLAASATPFLSYCVEPSRRASAPQ